MHCLEFTTSINLKTRIKNAFKLYNPIVNKINVNLSTTQLQRAEHNSTHQLWRYIRGRQIIVKYLKRVEKAICLGHFLMYDKVHRTSLPYGLSMCLNLWLN